MVLLGGSQCWPRFMALYGVTRLQWVDWHAALTKSCVFQTIQLSYIPWTKRAGPCKNPWVMLWFFQSTAMLWLFLANKSTSYWCFGSWSGNPLAYANTIWGQSIFWHQGVCHPSGLVANGIQYTLDIHRVITTRSFEHHVVSNRQQQLGSWKKACSG